MPRGCGKTWYTVRTMGAKDVHIYTFGGILAAAFLLSLFIFLPYLDTIVLVAAIAIAADPLFRRLAGVTRHTGLAAFLSVILILLIVLGPLTFLGVRIFQEAFGLYFQLAQGGVPEFIASGLQDIERRVPGANVGAISADVSSYLAQFAGWLFQNVGSVFASVTDAALQIFIGLIALYYFFKDGNRIRNALVHFAPIPKDDAETILRKMHLAVNSVIRGSFVVAIVQGVLAGLGFYLFGIPRAALWGLVTAIASLVPVAGTSLVLVPAFAYLVFAEQYFAASGFAAWGIVIVGLVDNFLRPQLLKKDFHLHPLILLLSVLGGIRLFGPIGFIEGPIAVGLFFALLDSYTHLVTGKQHRTAGS